MPQIETEKLFSKGVNNIPKSFLREILKVTSQPDVISFAGGLPNPELFPVEAIKQASIKVLENDGRNVLQYAVSEGYLPLRKYIADLYAQKGLQIDADEIIITSGSQQALDLIGKVFLNPGDDVIMERPGYLGAIQAFSVYQPNFKGVELLDDGIDLEEFERVIENYPAKLFYTVPNFQNPTGITASEEKRRKIAEIINQRNTIVVEDDPYGDINFTGKGLPSIKSLIGDKGILLGSFSKIISPGIRLGWIVAEKRITQKILLAKQASDLHSNFLSQRIIHQFLTDNCLDSHIKSICFSYQEQKNFMVELMKNYFPKEIKYNDPGGGMFIWVTLPDSLSAYHLLEAAAKEKVVFVPGEIFFIDRIRNNTLRLNFSNSNFNQMEKGMKVLSGLLKRLI